MERPKPETPDLAEHGGKGQTLDRRLFMQLHAFGGCPDSKPVVDAVRSAGVEAVVYDDVHDPYGVAVLSISENPSVFVDTWRAIFREAPFHRMPHKLGFAMMGRTYAMGYEPDLEHTLLDRPRQTALNPDWPWAVWYPLRRSGAFERLATEEQRAILSEHGQIGMGFGAGDFAHDIRLACHGLDRHDNDFVVGLVGKRLHPLSALVQRMRKTRQTCEFLERLGPFFVGRVAWQSQLG